MNELVKQKLEEKFPEYIKDVIIFRDEITFLVEKIIIKELMMFLRDSESLSYDLLIDVCGVDRAKRKERFEVVYNLYSIKNKHRIRIKSRIEEENCEISSVCSVYPGANWAEREAYDMFGIKFTDHPDLRRMYMPEEYEYYPLRKDFPLMGIPGSIQLPKR